MESTPTPLWIRSTVQLDAVSAETDALTYAFTAHGLSQITFSEPVKDARFEGIADVTWTESEGLSTAHFTHFGPAALTIDHRG